jgi:hypothetical protein
MGPIYLLIKTSWICLESQPVYNSACSFVISTRKIISFLVDIIPYKAVDFSPFSKTLPLTVLKFLTSKWGKCLLTIKSAKLFEKVQRYNLSVFGSIIA